jgi:hypothetical protein
MCLYVCEKRHEDNRLDIFVSDISNIFKTTWLQHLMEHLRVHSQLRGMLYER